MKNNMLIKRTTLADGEIVPLYYDQSFKIMFANNDHLEILTMLISKILNISYDDLIGKITILSGFIDNKKVDDKKSVSEILVSIKNDFKIRIIMEVNIKPIYYESIINRNLYYTFNHLENLTEIDSYIDMSLTMLVNFNSFPIKGSNEAIDWYLIKNDEGNNLSEKFKFLNINIVECHKIWRDNKYQKFNSLNKDLLLLSASLMATTKEEFENITSEINMSDKVRRKMKRVLESMNSNSELIDDFFDWEKEKKRIEDSIREEE